MSTSSVRVITSLRDSGYYLPAIAVGVLYLENATPSLWSHDISTGLLFPLTGFLLLAGTIMHEIEKAVSGPESDRKPTSYEQAIQKIFHVLYGKGRPSDYPQDWRELSEIEHSISKYRLLLSIIVGFLYLLLLLAYPLTVINLIEILPRAKYTVGTIAFIEMAFILQTLNQFVWPYSYLEEKEASKISVVDKESEFKITLSYLESINLIDTSYELTEGGIFHVNYNLEIEDNDDILDSIEAIAYIYKGTMGDSVYPCSRLSATIVENDNKIAEYRIENKWLRELEKNKISHTDFISKVLDSFEFP